MILRIFYLLEYCLDGIFICGDVLMFVCVMFWMVSFGVLLMFFFWHFWLNGGVLLIFCLIYWYFFVMFLF